MQHHSYNRLVGSLPSERELYHEGKQACPRDDRQHTGTSPEISDPVEFPRLGAQPSAAKAKASAPPVQAPLVKPVKTGPKEQKLPKHMRSHRGKDYWELHDQLVLVLLSVFPVMARHNVLTHVLCEKYFNMTNVSSVAALFMEPPLLRDSLYRFTVRTLEEMCLGYMRSLELHRLPGFQENAGMSSRNVPADWPLHLEASLQLHMTTKGGLLSDASSQASVPTRVYTIPYEPRVCLDPLPTALRTYVAGAEYPLLLKESLRAPWTLMRDHPGTRITPAAGVDFGLRRCMPVAAAHQGALAGMNLDALAMAAAAAAAPAFYRQVTIHNEATHGWLLLLGLHSVPALLPTLRLMDDLGYAEACMERLGTASPSMSMDHAVWIPPGGAFHLTVQLRCIPQQQGVLSQWLLCVCCRCMQQGDQWHPLDLFIVGRQLTATVTLNPDDVTHTLSSAATPFFPARLRHLFDSPLGRGLLLGPSPVSILLGGDRRWQDEMHSVERMLGRVDTAIAAAGLLPEGLQIHHMFQPGPTNNGLHSNGTWMSEKSEERAAARLQHQAALQLWRRLLRMEANAQARDITRYDMFNIHLQPCELVVDGPAGEKWPLFKLHVPGLPESRPPVFVGDVLHLRPNGELEYQLELAVAVFAVSTRDATVHVVLPALSQGQPLLAHLRSNGLWHLRFEFESQFFSRALTAIQRAESAAFPLLPLPNLCAFYPEEPSEAPTGGVGGVSESSEARDKPSDRWPISSSLNMEQRQAVAAVLHGHARGGIFVLFGPPGTGKTITVAQTIAQLLRAQPRAHILVCAPAPFAADVLASKLVSEHGLSHTQLVRINDPRRDFASVKGDVLPFCSREEVPAAIFRLPLRDELDALNVWVCTCASAALLYEAPDAWRRAVRPFTHIFLDEAGQATVPESLIPLSFATEPSCSVVLAGDPHQLGPVVHSSQAMAAGFGTSLLEMFMKVRRNARDGEGVNASAPVDGMVQLVRNYRSHQDLLDLPSQLFYGGVLRSACRSEDVTLPGTLSESYDLSDSVRTIFCGVRGEQRQEKDAPSYFNPQECTELVDTVHRMLSEPAFGLGAADIGVMATYRRQVQKIRLLLRSKGLGAVRVGTVDDYQGQEERIIFISTVLTQKGTVHGGNDHVDPNLAFLTSAQRFNVAISRAKVLNVVFGHPMLLLECKPWRELLRRCIGRGAYRGYGSEHVRNTVGSLRSAYEGYEGHEGDETDAGQGGEVGEGEDVWSAIAQLAESAVLGVGHAHGEMLDSAYWEEQEWRVAL